MATPKLMLFVGAPPASTLSPESCTLQELDDGFAAFLGIPRGQQRLQPSPPSSQVAWRSLPLTRQPLHTGFSQTHDVSDYYLLPSRPEFFTTAQVSCDASFDGELPSIDSEGMHHVLSQFYDHSLAVHNSIPSSQLESHDQSSTTDTSFMTTSSTDQPCATSIPVPCHLSDLEDIPRARHIEALSPQTVTLNLIVGVLSIAQPRTVTTRWGRVLALVEVLVGDDTKSGFAVTFWLSNDNAIETQVRSLRRQDVVLMQNVALHVFRGKVYGQSLRKDMTKVNLLWRRDGSGLYSTKDLARRAQRHPQVEKTRHVKDWVLKFVGGEPVSKTRAARKSWDRPPDDTQRIDQNTSIMNPVFQIG
ncbi:hypothetical protein EDB81DRAFT_12556 [Dactylonectria macrodidyma]|uniref:Nucleic acid-binding, OB-fold protein n=1 Tax=Dactylonectria macrodidyma TaxID=307937 RepID=A0A9P9FQV7_9HYPO|nr:hypothetical protein EDB81DRAFT_12556 [Dactylonectria macrodidyma]